MPLNRSEISSYFFPPSKKSDKKDSRNNGRKRQSLVGLCSWIAFGNKVNKEMLWLVRQRRFMRVRHVRRIQFRDLFEYYGFFLMPERVWIWHLKGSATIIQVIPFYCLKSRERLKHQGDARSKLNLLLILLVT